MYIIIRLYFIFILDVDDRQTTTHLTLVIWHITIIIINRYGAVDLILMYFMHICVTCYMLFCVIGSSHSQILLWVECFICICICICVLVVCCTSLPFIYVYIHVHVYWTVCVLIRVLFQGLSSINIIIIMSIIIITWYIGICTHIMSYSMVHIIINCLIFCLWWLIMFGCFIILHWV